MQPQTRRVRHSVIREAFWNQHNVIALGGLAVFSLASESVFPLMFAAGGEVLWLAIAVNSPGFRQWVASQTRAREEARWASAVDTVAANLDADATVRLRALGNLLIEIERASSERGNPEFSSAVGARLENLLRIYADLAASHRRLARLLALGGSEAVDAELARLHRELGEEKDATVRISLRQALTLFQRRRKRYEQLETVARELAVKISGLEASAEFVRLQVRGGEREDDVLLALDEMRSAASFDPQSEAEAIRFLGERRMTSTAHTVTQTFEG